MSVLGDILERLKESVGKIAKAEEWGYREQEHYDEEDPPGLIGTVRVATFRARFRLTDVPDDATAAAASLPKGVRVQFKPKTWGMITDVDSGSALTQLRTMITKVADAIAAAEVAALDSRRIQCLGWLEAEDGAELP